MTILHSIKPLARFSSPKETASTTSNYADGEFDAIIGVEPDRQLINDRSYLQGYVDHYWESHKKSHDLQTCSETVELAKSNYSDGCFDGSIGLEPQPKLLINSMAYRSGYQEGIIKFYLEKQQLSN